MTEQLLSEDVTEAWMYILESMIFCGARESMTDADFRRFVGNLQYHYPDEFEVVMEVLEKKEFLNVEKEGDSNGI